jgi:hypothetical protein
MKNAEAKRLHPILLDRRLLLCLWGFLVIVAKPCYGQELGVFQKGDVTILFEKPLRVGAEEAAEIYPIIRRDLEKIFRWRVDFSPKVLLIKESRTFQRMARSSLVVAFAVPEKNLMVIDYSKMRIDPFTIETTMKHELCHLMLHHHLKEAEIPKWLDEGIAQWVSGGIAEIIRSQKKSHLTEATLAGKVISIRALTHRFPGDRESLLLAYEESKSLVSYIIDTYGFEGILRTLDYLEEGYEWEPAILRGLSVTFDELERDWHRHLKKRLTWFTYLINHLYEVLFFLGAVIMIYASVKFMLRKRAYMREMEDDPTLH